MFVDAKTADGRAVRLTPHRFPDGYGLEFRQNLDVSLPGQQEGDASPLRVDSMEELKKLAASDLFVVPFSHPDWNDGAVSQHYLESISFDGMARN